MYQRLYAVYRAKEIMLILNLFRYVLSSDSRMNTYMHTLVSRRGEKSDL